MAKAVSPPASVFQKWESSESKFFTKKIYFSLSSLN